MLTPKAPSWMSEFRKRSSCAATSSISQSVSSSAPPSPALSAAWSKMSSIQLLGLATGGVDFSNVFFPLNGQHYANLADAQKAGAPTLNVGLFINAIIQFLIVSFAVFWVVKALTKLNVRQDAAAAPRRNPRFC